jgi:hypothetical protein
VRGWIKDAIIFPTIRLSEPVSINTESTKHFVFPSAAMMREWRGVLYTLAGFKNSDQYGEDVAFNFILSNDTQSTQRDARCPTNFYHFISKDAR